MPVLQGKLAGHQGGTNVKAVVEDLEQVALLFFGGWGHTQIIQDQQIHFGELFEQLGVTPIALSDREFGKEPG